MPKCNVNSKAQYVLAVMIYTILFLFYSNYVMVSINARRQLDLLVLTDVAESTHHLTS